MVDYIHPANPNANADAGKLLNWLAGLPERPDKRVISGQQLWSGEDTPAGFAHFVERLHDETGKWPAMIGLDYCKPWTTERQDRSIVNEVAIDYWRNGGLVTFIWLARNPWTGGPYQNEDNPGWDVQSVDLRELITPGSDLYDYWMSELDYVAGGFADLRDAGVVVLWRPFLEATYPDAFWWSSTHAPDAYRALWRHMFDYFTNDRGLDNLLWVYNAPNQDQFRPVDLVYPGGDVVDFVTLDVYRDNTVVMGDGYNRLLNLNKPFYFAEVGPDFGGGKATGDWDTTTIIRAIRERYLMASGWLCWASWSTEKLALVDNRNAAALLDDSWVIIREEVDWRSGLTPNDITIGDPQPVDTGSPPQTGSNPIPNEIIIDDTDAGFSTSFSQDDWQKYTQDGGQHYGNSHYYNREIGSGQDTATWSFTVSEPGNYDVYAWWWEGDWRPSDVPYTVNHFYGSTTVRMDQRASGGQWNLLGTFYWHDEGSVVVSDDTSSGRDIVADAIRLVYRSEGEKKTLLEELEALRAKLEALNVVGVTAMLVHVDNALARLEELGRKGSTTGIA